MNSDAIALQAPRDTAFLGHPKGLFFLAFTEAWERFSFYGMTALVVLYMVNQLLLPGHVEHIAGIAGFRAAIESIFGPLSTQALASEIYGLYSAFVYFTPLLGGIVADGSRNRVLQRGSLFARCGGMGQSLDAGQRCHRGERQGCRLQGATSGLSRTRGSPT